MNQEICNILTNCGCFEYHDYFAGLQSKEDLYRFSLSDLVQTLPFGHDGRCAAYNLHTHLGDLQRRELDTWVDPRQHDEGHQFIAPQFAASSSSKRSAAQRNGSGGQTLPVKQMYECLKTGGKKVDGRSRSYHESEYKSSPHIIPSTNNLGRKCYLCKYCQKSFAAPNQAVIHTRKHTGEKPYECDHCDKQFTQVSARNLHMKKEHKTKVPLKRFTPVKATANKDVIKAFACPHCDRSYTQISSRNLHCRNAHPDQNY